MSQREAQPDDTSPAPAVLRPGQLSALLQDLVQAPQDRLGSDWEHALKPGVVIGRFELIRAIGRGGFGTVWEAKDRDLGRSVAFKLVRAGGGPDVLEERVLAEAEVAAKLSHPNIVTLHDVGRCEHGPYLVLELLRGQTLARRLEQGPLAVGEALRIGTEVAKGLAHAHAHGVVHRDLTPGNVFLCEDGQVKVLDLGMAHAFGHRRLEGGTPGYMAPEQRAGAPEDERTDVFALGVILYRMLANELPFPDGASRSNRPAPALEVQAAPALGAIVGRLLEPDPVNRPRDGREVSAALRAIQQELDRTPSATGAVTTRPRSGLAGLLSEVRRRRVLPALVAYGTVALVALKVADWLSHTGRLPAWALATMLAVVTLGFPISAVIAWTFDLTGQGIRRTPPASTRTPTRSRLVLVVAGLGVLALIPAMAWWAFRERRTPGPRGDATLAGSVTPVSNADPRAIASSASQPMQGQPGAVEGGPSVAVLPFADMSPGRDQEYFADGVSEEILNALSRVKELRVIGRTSSFSFRGKEDDLRTIGRKLTVRHILEGSVRRDGARVRITARLVDVSNGERLWSEAYERELTDVFRIQDEVATSVAEALRVNLTGMNPAPAGARTPHAEAYRYHLLGRRFLSTPNPDTNRRAMESFEKALAIDPAYASAWAGLAIASHQFARGRPPEEADRLRRRAIDAAEKSVALAPDLPHALAARGWLRMFATEWEGADQDLALAVKLGPGVSTTHNSRAVLLHCLGRLSEAVAEARQAIELDPLATQPLNSLGSIFSSMGQLGEARRTLERALEISPTQAYAIANLAEVLLLSAQPREALELAEKIPWEAPRLAAIAMAEHDLGRVAESQQALEALVTRFATTDALEIATVHAWRDEKDPAFEWLERALHQPGWNGGIKTAPAFRRLRGDPRWNALLRKMNLPVD